MLNADVFIFKPLRFLFGLEQDPVQPLTDIDFTSLDTRAGDCGPLVEQPLQLTGQPLRIDIDLLQQAWHQTRLLLQQGEQQVFAIDLEVPAAHTGVLRLLEGFLALLCQSVKVHYCSFLVLL